MAAENRGAGRSGYAIAAMIFLAGVVIAGALLAFVIYSVVNLDDEMERVPIPGTAEVSLDETGRYTVFYERQSGIDERGFDNEDDTPALDIQIIQTATGDEIPVSSGFGDVNYDFWSRSGDSVGSFEINEPGTYEITVDYASGEPVDTDAMLALGEGIGTTIILVVVAALGSGAFFCGTLGVAIIILIITLIRRSRT